MISPIIRRASRKDGPVLLRLVDALARYEKLAPPDDHARVRLIDDLSGERPRFEAYLAELDGAAAGYAFVFETYSSFLALPTLYLEDLFVLPEFRGRRIGYALFTAMVREAFHRGCGRMEWTVLDWNRPALDFYVKTGATKMNEWQLYRLVRDDMKAIVNG